jgi:CBS domain containing-hemolysin-like protein
MRRTHSHLVLVSDGARPLGVATLDDVLSAVVGAPVSASAKSAS